jgi:hypothetical protein
VLGLKLRYRRYVSNVEVSYLRWVNHVGQKVAHQHEEGGRKKMLQKFLLVLRGVGCLDCTCKELLFISNAVYDGTTGETRLRFEAHVGCYMGAFLSKMVVGVSFMCAQCLITA